MAKSIFGKIWYFIWEDDSALSWIVNVILAFVIIKYLVYPGLGMALGTWFPIVAVISNSMEHDGNYDEFWEQHGEFYDKMGIGKEDFRSYTLKNGFNTGDIIILKGTSAEDAKLGDIIVYKSIRKNQEEPIIHRVVNKWSDEEGSYFQTKGDHNPGSNPDEMKVNENSVIGKAVFRIPVLGWIKIIFVRIITIFALLLGL